MSSQDITTSEDDTTITETASDVKDCSLSDSEPFPDRLLELQADLGPFYREFDADKIKGMTKSHIDKLLQSKDPFKIRNFGSCMTWYNTSRCLCLDDDLKNRVLVLDFFTYSSINCLHILPTLKNIEENFPVSRGLAVIGIQSHKFPAEKQNGGVKEAVIRHDIHHPVVNDTGCYLWITLHIKERPTVLIIGPEGHVLFTLSGETDIKAKLHVLCWEVMAYFENQNYPLKKSALPISLLKDTVPTCGLQYPTNICIDEESDNIIISDTGHNRVIIVSENGQLLDIAGSGVKGHFDGSFEEATFNSPHGLAWRGPHYVFVADTGNHTIRHLDLVKRRVLTSTGTDKSKAVSDTGNEDQILLSPFGLCFGPNVGNIKDECGVLNSLYIASTGSNQICVLFFENFVDTSQQFRYECKIGQLEVFAGSGKEECTNCDNRLLSSFAQPSGISFSNECVQSVFVTDSESSAIRSVSMADGSVKTLAGGPVDPTNMFAYGDEDGKGRFVQFQHPMGIAVLDQNYIFVADTYNHKIKLIHSKDEIDFIKTITYAGTGSYGNTISENPYLCEFNEPTGLCLSKDRKTLYIVDTNNHCIKMADLVNHSISLFKIQGLFATSSKPIKIVNYLSSTELRQEQPAVKEPVKISVRPGGEIRCYFSIQSDFHIVPAEGVNQPWKITFSGKPLSINCRSNIIFDENFQPSLTLKDEAREKTETRVNLDVTLRFRDKMDISFFSRKTKFEFVVKITGKTSKRVEHVNMICIVK